MHPIFETSKPEGFNSLNTYLFAEDPEGLIAFLKKVFYAEEKSRVLRPETKEIANVILQIGDTNIMISQASGPFLKMRTCFYLYVNDVDLAYTRALENGGINVFAPEDMSFGDRQGGIEDPFGNFWWISKRLVSGNYTSN